MRQRGARERKRVPHLAHLECFSTLLSASPISFKTPGGVELTVGIHLLEGSIVPLKKPFAVLEKRGGRGGDAENEAPGTSSPAAHLSSSASPSAAPASSTSPVSYEVVGVIRRKCLFKSRPRALISGPGALARQVERAAEKAAARAEQAAAAEEEAAGAGAEGMVE